MLRAALPGIVTVQFQRRTWSRAPSSSRTSSRGRASGQYAYHSATTLDLPAIMGVSLFVAVVYIVVNFFVDILYGVVDPRLRIS